MIVRGDGFSVHVASVDDIIAAKTFANRDKDREALPELLEIQERERAENHEQYQIEIEFEVDDGPNRGIEP
jgi:hypothetical protein